MAKASNLIKFTSFKSEDEAIALLESLRWPNGVACPHCGGLDPYKLTPRAETKTRTQKGLWKCSQCRKKFTVKTGSIFEASHIPASKWLMAVHLICASKKGMSALQFQRMLGVTYRTAWFMAHRIRHAMAEDGTFFPLSGTVEVDETYVGGRRRGTKRGRPTLGESHKSAVVVLVERKGRAKAFPVDRVDGKTLREAITSNVRPNTTALVTDDMPSYNGMDQHVLAHDTVTHSAGEYVRREDHNTIHTNTAEGFFAILKRGINGTFHHVSKGHLHRYCDEFSFRYSHRAALGVNDLDRTKLLVLAAEGKRLTYKQPSGARA